MASGTDTPHITYEVMRVPRACSGFGKTSAISAPAPAATIVAAIGRSCAAVMRSRDCWLECEMSNMDKERVTSAATALSITQHTHANVTAQGPHAGTQTNIHISTSVANPIGMVPKNSAFVESIMTDHISGYS